MAANVAWWWRVDIRRAKKIQPPWQHSMAWAAIVIASSNGDDLGLQFRDQAIFARCLVWLSTGIRRPTCFGISASSSVAGCLTCKTCHFATSSGKIAPPRPNMPKFFDWCSISVSGDIANALRKTIAAAMPPVISYTVGVNTARDTCGVR